MSGSVNRVILLGRLGADPETRRLQSGDAVVSFRLATTETWRDGQSGERRERTEWHSVVVFNEHLAKVAGDFLKKGTMAYVEGQLQTRSWEDQSGAKRYATEIVLQRFRGELQLLGDGEKGGAASADRGADRRPSEPKGASNRQASGRGNYGEASGRSATKPKSAERDYSFDDEIPF